MTKLHSIARAASDDLRARVHFCAETGQIWLHEHRMLLVHAEAQALLRKELIDYARHGPRPGPAHAHGLRLGPARRRARAHARRGLQRHRGLHDRAAAAHARGHRARHAGQARARSRQPAKFYGEFLWENSWEGQWHRHHYGIHSEPVCWTQIGYACGYTSAFMGRPILYKEVECVGMGHNNCRIIGKPVEEWEDAAEHMRFFRPRVDRRPADRAADPGRAVALDDRRQGEAARPT